MPLDQFKTQVLLLHSEQSTLDSLSSGFSDRFTVHCATSGSEALNFLGDTPIHVIISAQDLPGMSGAEALREAKKRSPETIGILLAGSSDEAFVGEKELFEVVRGEVSADSLQQMIDTTTQQMRILALSESANDTTAGGDDTSEHIIMETDANGSTIISDGTGRLPALDPSKVSAAASVGSRGVDVLVLTKDEEFLATVRDSARGLHNVLYAQSLGEADDAVAKHKVGVAVVDAGMVGSKVEKLTLHLRRTAPRLVSIVAGRRDDGEMLMDLINRGKVYRFLLKPVSPGRARLAIEASIKHHLEAPDSAFKIAAGSDAPAPKPAAKAKPAPKAKPKPAPAPAPAAKPKVAATARTEPVIGESSPVVEGLSDAFGEGDSSFTQTMTGIVTSVGKSISDIKDSVGSKPDAGDAGGSGGSSFASPKIIGVAVAAVAVIVAGIFFATRSSDDEPASVAEEQRPAAAVAEEEPVVEAPRPEPEPEASSADELLDAARLARDAEQLFAPEGDNAIALYSAALAEDPGNAEIAAERDAVITQAIGMAETAMLSANVEEAVTILDRVAAADPDNSRLPFLATQVSQMQLRGYLDEARAAIRDSRFEDAAASINAARALNIDDTGAIDAVQAELSDASNARQIDEVLAIANARLEEGALLTPANDNARYYFNLALNNDPDNALARQGLSVVATRLAIAARDEIDAGRFGSAEALLADAARVDPASSDVASATAALQDARNQTAAARARAEQAAQRQAEEERARLERERLEQARAEQEAAEQAAAEQAAAEAAPVAEQSDQLEPAGDPVAEQLEQQQEPEPVAEPVQDDAPVSVSSLTRRKYVAPKYPRSAERRNQSGWVDIVFTVATDGSVKNIVVRESEPGDLFVNAARKAVERWEFEPVLDDNGIATEKRAAVRMLFAIE